MPDYDINCRQLSDLTTDYFEGAMSPRLRTTFEQHVVFRGYCVVHLDQVRATLAILSSLPKPAPPVETTRAIVEAVAAHRG